MTSDTKAIITAIAVATITIVGITAGMILSFRAEMRADMREMQAAINKNTVAIAKLESAVDANTAAIANLEDKIDANTAAIAVNTAAIAKLEGALSAHLGSHAHAPVVAKKEE